MKKYIKFCVVTILLVINMAACKKENDLKDYISSINEKTWWGELTYTGKTPEVYSVHFNADKTLIWSQFSGDYTGHWIINENELTLTFDASTAEVKATITQDDKLATISDNTNSYEINNGNLIKVSNINLDNTEWIGKLSISTGTYHDYKINFFPGSKIVVDEQGVTYTNNSYSRTPSGAVIRTKFQSGSGAYLNFFGIIVSETEMYGSQKNSESRWFAKK